MRRIKIAGLCLVAVFAIAATAASTASAAAPEFGRCKKVTPKALSNYDSAKCIKLASEDTGTEEEKLKKGNFQWFPGFGEKTNFTSKMKSETIATLETVGGTKITCTGETSNGHYVTGGTNKLVAGITAKFTGCETSGFPCNSAGKSSGQIDTHPLGGTIGFETEVSPPSKNHIAQELHSEEGNVAEFTCAGLPVVVKGSVLHKITANAMKLTATEKFTASKGKQKPEHFAGGVAKEHILESNTNGGPFEQAGQTITTILTNEEKVEANTVL
jgi:hypothetical protein